MYKRFHFIRKISILMIIFLITGLISPTLSVNAGAKKGYYLLEEYFQDGVTILAYLDGNKKPKFFIMDDKGKKTELK